MRMFVVLFALLFLGSSTVCGAAEIAYELKCYPENPKVCDTVYMMITCRNNSKDSIHQPLPQQRVRYQLCYAKTELVDGESSWQFAFTIPGTDIMRGNTGIGNPPVVSIAPQTQAVILSERIQLPPLEDLHEPFWENIVDSLTAAGKEIDLTVNLFQGIRPNEVMRQRIKLFPLAPAEMKRTNEWHHHSKKRLNIVREVVEKSHFPVVLKQRTLTREGKETSNQPKLADFYNTISWGDVIFPRMPPAAQRWKELEESLPSGVMLDEIRLTRMLIQYCDTKDKKVLEELKKWFSEMNEVQRTCMAKSVLNRARGTFDHDTELTLRDLYHAIREYDISAKSESEAKYLKQLGLLE